MRQRSRPIPSFGNYGNGLIHNSFNAPKIVYPRLARSEQDGENFYKVMNEWKRLLREAKQ